MSKAKAPAATALTAAAVGGATLATASPAAAAYTCKQAIAVANFDSAMGDLAMSQGRYQDATAWYARAAGILEAAC
jgi:hypothetical protein